MCECPCPVFTHHVPSSLSPRVRRHVVSSAGSNPASTRTLCLHVRPSTSVSAAHPDTSTLTKLSHTPSSQDAASGHKRPQAATSGCMRLHAAASGCKRLQAAASGQVHTDTCAVLPAGQLPTLLQPGSGGRHPALPGQEPTHAHHHAGEARSHTRREPCCTTHPSDCAPHCCTNWPPSRCGGAAGTGLGGEGALLGMS